MAIESICSGCGRGLSVGNEHVGKKARCPNCGQIYTVPHFVTPQAVPSNVAASSSSTSTQPADSAAPSFSANPGQFDHQPNDAASPYPPATEAFQPAEQFWMRGADGIEYGPADRATLNRWFAEGRVGADYQIKHNANGIWQAAQIFRPSSTTPAQANNPFAETQSPYAAPQSTQTAAGFQKSDPSALVLTMGIVAWILFFACPLLSLIPGIIAWVTGRNALQDIQAGLADVSNEGLVKTGYYLGMTQVILFLLLVVFVVGFFAVAIVLDGM